MIKKQKKINNYNKQLKIIIKLQKVLSISIKKMRKSLRNYNRKFLRKKKLKDYNK